MNKVNRMNKTIEHDGVGQSNYSLVTRALLVTHRTNNIVNLSLVLLIRKLMKCL